MERRADAAPTRRTDPSGAASFYQVLDLADVDVDLRILIDRWSGEGEIAVVQRDPSASGAVGR